MKGNSNNPHDHHHHHEEEEDDAAAYMTTEAGLVRAVIRSSISVYRSILFGSFPRRVPLKAVAKVTDSASQAWDAYAVLKDTHKEVATSETQQNKRHSRAGDAGAAVWRKAQILGQTLRGAAPQLLKSGFLGTAVFELYDTTKDRLDAALGIGEETDEAAGPMRSHLWLPVTAVVGGSLAGSAHGVLYVGWEHGRRLFFNSGHVVSNVWGGTAAAHALAHATLFGSFEVFKEGLLHATGARHEEPLGVAVVGLAGGLAGLCEETVSSLTPSWETERVSGLRTAIKRHGLPSFRALAPSFLPASLGFLAWEYGRKAGVGDD